MRSDVRRAGERYVTEGDGVRTLHSFSYGVHYDPANTGFGDVVAVNEEVVDPGRGYAEHRHSDVEIVTWVLDGELAHHDTTGTHGTVRPGTAQRLSAGEGARHEEMNASDVEPLRFVQTMLRSRHASAPEYASLDVPPGPGLHAGVTLHAAAELLVARPSAEVAVTVPASPALLVHVTRGSVAVAGELLGPGDALRAGDVEADVVLEGDGEALVWRLGRSA
ncbi:MAG: pirin family protein [Propionibacteriales bacterium]|nr:pirin family protein [Propionibacteriales bacterium]